MRRHLSTFLLVSLSLAACGDEPANTPPPPDTAVVVDAAPDARVCDLASYPLPVRTITVDLANKFPLTLDGVGTRCDQIVRALTDPNPSLRPPELAMLDVVGVTAACHYSDTSRADVVRLSAPLYNGIPMFSPPQDAVVHVDAQDTVIYLHGDYLPAGSTVAEGCLSEDDLARSIPGHALSYRKLLLCQYRGDGAYEVANDDEIVAADEGYLIDSDHKLRRVRAMDVFLLEDHVNSEITNSDAFCCNGTLDHCVGQRLFVDALTGEIISQEPHCHSC